MGLMPWTVVAGRPLTRNRARNSRLVAIRLGFMVSRRWALVSAAPVRVVPPLRRLTGEWPCEMQDASSAQHGQGRAVAAWTAKRRACEGQARGHPRRRVRAVLALVAAPCPGWSEPR